MGRRLKFIVIQYLTKKLLKAITEDEILQITSEGYMVNKRKLGTDEVSAIKQDARWLQDSALWGYMEREVEYIAFVTGRKAKTDDDNLACHYMFYNLDLLRKFIKNLSR